MPYRFPSVIFSDRARIFFVGLLASHNPKTAIKKMSVCLYRVCAHRGIIPNFHFFVIFSDRAKNFFVVLLASHNPKTTIKKMSVCLSVCLSVCPICSLCRFWSISSCSIAFYFHMWLIWTIPQGCFSSDFSFDPPLSSSPPPHKMTVL